MVDTELSRRKFLETAGKVAGTAFLGNAIDNVIKPAKGEVGGLLGQSTGIRTSGRGSELKQDNPDISVNDLLKMVVGSGGEGRVFVQKGVADAISAGEKGDQAQKLVRSVYELGSLSSNGEKVQLAGWDLGKPAEVKRGGKPGLWDDSSRFTGKRIKDLKAGQVVRVIGEVTGTPFRLAFSRGIEGDQLGFVRKELITEEAKPPTLQREITTAISKILKQPGAGEMVELGVNALYKSEKYPEFGGVDLTELTVTDGKFVLVNGGADKIFEAIVTTFALQKGKSNADLLSEIRSGKGKVTVLMPETALVRNNVSCVSPKETEIDLHKPVSFRMYDEPPTDSGIKSYGIGEIHYKWPTGDDWYVFGVQNGQLVFGENRAKHTFVQEKHPELSPHLIDALPLIDAGITLNIISQLGKIKTESYTSTPSEKRLVIQAIHAETQTKHTLTGLPDTDKFFFGGYHIVDIESIQKMADNSVMKFIPNK